MPYRKGGYNRDSTKAISSADAQRLLLEEYMVNNEGYNLPGDREQSATSIKSVRDERLCKCYLVGICPHDVLSKTKMDIGSCTKIHSKELKEKYMSKMIDQLEEARDGEINRQMKT